MQSSLNERTRHRDTLKMLKTPTSVLASTAANDTPTLWLTTATTAAAPTPTTTTVAAPIAATTMSATQATVATAKTMETTARQQQHHHHIHQQHQQDQKSTIALAAGVQGGARNNNINNNIINAGDRAAAAAAANTSTTNGRTGSPTSDVGTSVSTHSQKMASLSLHGATNAEEDEGGGAAHVQKDFPRLVLENGLDEVPQDTLGAAAYAPFAEENELDEAAGAFALSPPTPGRPSRCRLSPGSANDDDDDEDVAAAAAHSNRTSMNNSTENLSYASDIFYGDDLLLLGADGDDDDPVDVDCDGDLEAESVSLNSDDCVYAYRGDGADFELDALHVWHGGAAHGGVGGLALSGRLDDEMDFLEMDFEPDPLSEADYGYSEMTQAAAGVGTNAGAALSAGRSTTTTDAFLLQRDAYRLPSGRHSALGHTSPSQQRQRRLFSSPSDDLPPLSKTLQAQALLGKSFARISLHLDQIRGDADDDEDGEEHNHTASTAARSGASDDGVVSVMGGCGAGQQPGGEVGGVAGTPGGLLPLVGGSLAGTASHSLPSTLHGHCGREQETAGGIPATHKVTGAKPKRLSTFSASSSTSSKNSSKSRSSLRCGVYAAPALCGSASFDERSVSCSEFRSSGVGVACCLTASSSSMATETGGGGGGLLPVSVEDFLSGGAADDSLCLDCLERDFLASTIGKTTERLECAKCQRRLGGGGGGSRAAVHRLGYLGRSLSGVGSGSSAGGQAMCGDMSLRCRSGSPTAFFPPLSDHEGDGDGGFFGGGGGGGEAADYSPTAGGHRRSGSSGCGGRYPHWPSRSGGVGGGGVESILSGRRRDGLTKGRAEQDLRTLDWNASCSTCDVMNAPTHTATEKGRGRGVEGRHMGRQQTSTARQYATMRHDDVTVVPASSTAVAGEEAIEAATIGGVALAGGARSVRRQRRSTCDNHKDEQLLSNFATDGPATVTISRANLCEDSLVQALDQLHVACNAELLKAHWKGGGHNNNNNISGNSSRHASHNSSNNKHYKDMRAFVLHASKRPWNPSRLRRLIDTATRQQIDVQFKEGPPTASPEMVAVRNADILQQWERHKRLDSLRNLDERFAEANVLGKIANIVRQAQRPRLATANNNANTAATSSASVATTTTTTASESEAHSTSQDTISIPQYYASGELVLSLKRNR